MRTIKIFCLPSHATKERTSGVDFARIIQPMKHLNGYFDGEVRFETTIYDPNEEELHNDPVEWLKVAREYDVIYFNYLHNPWGFAAMGSMAVSHGTKLVMDIDDALWSIRSDNPAYDVYKKDSPAIRDFTSICNAVDYMTTTSNYLKHVVMNNTDKKADKIEVFPNFIDLDLYSHQPGFKDTGRITLLHFGSTTHFIDLQEAEFIKGVDRILKEYPQVNIKFIGAFIPKFKEMWGMRYETGYGNEDIYRWINGKFKEYMDETDIMVVPLSVDIYNKSKSSIKFLEASSAKKPGVWQRIRQYEEVIDGKNGLLASKDSEWYQNIKRLIDDSNLRKQIGESAFKTVEEGWRIQDHIRDYAEFFKKVTEPPTNYLTSDFTHVPIESVQ